MRITDGRFNDAINGTSFEKIDAVIVANGRQVTIQSFSAHTAGDGTVQAQGNVTLDPQAGFPGNIQITMQKARLLSNETIRLVADAKLALSGAFATTPTLAGTIDVRSMDVNIAEKLPGSLTATEVRHVNVPGGQQAVAQTPQVKAQQRKKLQAKAQVAAAPLVATLDLNISAPNNVFVRGRGIEAEFGGSLKVTGTSLKPITNGGFDIRRGRFDVLDRRLNFSRGRITFRGSTDPELDIAADSQTAALTATVHITGQASAPKISFSSTPALPEDEVLAQLLFGKNAGSLSPGQAIQVARAIQQFTGNGSSRMDDVRRSLGISSLDIGTGENGTGQVGIGKRLNESLYLGVSQGTTSNSGQVSVDVDVMKNIKLQGRAGAAGAEIGIGAEWDY
jgi:translocation and assembly module TamB